MLQDYGLTTGRPGDKDEDEDPEFTYIEINNDLLREVDPEIRSMWESLPEEVRREVELGVRRGMIERRNAPDGSIGGALVGGFTNAAHRTIRQAARIPGIKQLAGQETLDRLDEEGRMLQQAYSDDTSDHPVAGFLGAAGFELPKFVLGARAGAAGLERMGAAIAGRSAAGSTAARAGNWVAQQAKNYGKGSFSTDAARDVIFGAPINSVEAYLSPEMRDMQGNLVRDAEGRPVRENLGGMARVLEQQDLGDGLLATSGETALDAVTAVSKIPLVGDLLAESLPDIAMAGGARGGSSAFRRFTKSGEAVDGARGLDPGDPRAAGMRDVDREPVEAELSEWPPEEATATRVDRPQEPEQYPAPTSRQIPEQSSAPGEFDIPPANMPPDPLQLTRGEWGEGMPVDDGPTPPGSRVSVGADGELPREYAGMEQSDDDLLKYVLDQWRKGNEPELPSMGRAPVEDVPLNEQSDDAMLEYLLEQYNRTGQTPDLPPMGGTSRGARATSSPESPARRSLPQPERLSEQDSDEALLKEALRKWQQTGEMPEFPSMGSVVGGSRKSAPRAAQQTPDDAQFIDDLIRQYDEGLGSTPSRVTRESDAPRLNEQSDDEFLNNLLKQYEKTGEIPELPSRQSKTGMDDAVPLNEQSDDEFIDYLSRQYQKTGELPTLPPRNIIETAEAATPETIESVVRQLDELDPEQLDALARELLEEDEYAEVMARYATEEAPVRQLDDVQVDNTKYRAGDNEVVVWPEGSLGGINEVPVKGAEPSLQVPATIKPLKERISDKFREMVRADPNQVLEDEGFAYAQAFARGENPRTPDRLATRDPDAGENKRLHQSVEPRLMAEDTWELSIKGEGDPFDTRAMVFKDQTENVNIMGKELKFKDSKPVFTVEVDGKAIASASSLREAQTEFARWALGAQKTNKVTGEAIWRERGEIARDVTKYAQSVDDPLQKDKLNALARASLNGSSLRGWKPLLDKLKADGVITTEVFETVMAAGALKATHDYMTNERAEAAYDVDRAEVPVFIAAGLAMGVLASTAGRSAQFKNFARNFSDIFNHKGSGTFRSKVVDFRAPLENAARQVSEEAGRRIENLVSSARGSAESAKVRYRDEVKPLIERIARVAKASPIVNTPEVKAVLDQISFTEDVLKADDASMEVAALLYVRRMQELMDQGRVKTPLDRATLDKAEQYLTLHPEIVSIADDAAEVYRNNLKRRLDSGNISEKEFSDLVSVGDNYVPLTRDLDDIKKWAQENGLEAILRRLDVVPGGQSRPGLQSMDNAEPIVTARTTSGRDVTEEELQLRAIDPLELMSIDVARTESDIFDQEVRNEIIRTFTDGDTEALREMGVRRVSGPVDETISGGGEGAGQNIVKIRGYRPDDPRNIVEDFFFEVDPDMRMAIEGLPSVKVWPIFRAAKNIQRVAITTSPYFAIRNGLRDTVFTTIRQSRNELLRGGIEGSVIGSAVGALTAEDEEDVVNRALMYGAAGFSLGAVGRNFGRTALAGMDIALGNNKELQKLWSQSGGPGAGFYSANKGRASAKEVVQRLSDHDPSLGALGVAFSEMRPFQFFEVVGQIVENAPRFAEFKKLIAEGIDPVEAAARSRDISVDFNRVGSNKLIRRVGGAEAFFNATIQGWDTFFRTMKDAEGTDDFTRKGFVKAAAIITPISLALWGLNKDNENYWREPAWVRNTFWLIPNPRFKDRSAESTIESTPFFKFAKPHEFGWMYGSLPERMLDAAVEGDVPLIEADVDRGVLSRSFLEAAASGLKDFAGQYGVGDLFPFTTVGRYALEQGFGYDIFKGRDIDPYSGSSAGFQNKDDELQYTSTTPGPYRALAKGVSMADELLGDIIPDAASRPSRIQHTAETFGGGWAREIAQGGDMLMKNYGTEGMQDMASKAPTRSAFVNAFMTDPASRSEREYNLYERFGGFQKDIDSNIQDMEKSGRIEELASFVNANRERLREGGALKYAYNELRKIQEQVRMVQQAPGIEPGRRSEILIMLNDQADKMLRSLGAF